MSDATSHRAAIDEAMRLYEEHHPGHACADCLAAVMELATRPPACTLELRASGRETDAPGGNPETRGGWPERQGGQNE